MLRYRLKLDGGAWWGESLRLGRSRDLDPVINIAGIERPSVEIVPRIASMMRLYESRKRLAPLPGQRRVAPSDKALKAHTHAPKSPQGRCQ